MFIRNAWYVAALARDINRTPVRSGLLGDVIVLFRKLTGELIALRDRCPHRHAPLSLGTLVDDEIQCRYHGFRFNSVGACTHIPGEAAIPAAIAVDKFAVREMHGFVWVWMGDAASADESSLPSWPWREKAGFMSYHTDYVFDAPFQLIVDNLMDLTHVHFVHRILGAGNLIHESEPMKTWESGNEIYFQRDMKAKRATQDGYYVQIGGQYISPSTVVTSAVPKRQGSDEIQGGPVSQVMHCLTPVNANVTRYFTLKSWNCYVQPHEVAAVHHQIEVTLAEDKAVIEAQFANKESAEVPERLVRADRAAVMARRVYDRILSQNRGTA